jgi:hypothetical protein
LSPTIQASWPGGIGGLSVCSASHLLPLLNAGRIVLPKSDRLANQIVGLERRVARSGRDSIDHGPGGHDDLVNAVAGAADLAAVRREPVATDLGNPYSSGRDGSGFDNPFSGEGGSNPDRPEPAPWLL